MENTDFIIPQVAEIKLTYSLPVKPSKLPKVAASRQAKEFFFQNWDLNKIEFCGAVQSHDAQLGQQGARHP